ncbi:MAG: hypothetical protein ACFFCD_15365 [Promethearchaeota archaeon]
MKKTVICDICGKVCKNQRGLAIHIGHMHKHKGDLSIKEDFHTLKDVDLVTKNDIIAELHSLRQLILNVSTVLRQMKHDNNNSIKWEPLTESFSTDMNSLMESPISGLPLGMNYGYNHGALMDELRSVLKERVLVSA